MLERSAMQQATSASTENNHAQEPPVQEEYQQQQTTSTKREGDAIAAPYLDERTTVNISILSSFIKLLELVRIHAHGLIRFRVQL
jgi:hypothetical protein